MDSGFSGDKQGFRLTAAGDQGPRELALGVKEGRLILSDRLMRSPGDQAVTDIPLGDTVDHLEISYYDPEERIWLSEWRIAERGRPPSLVRIRVFFGVPGHLRGSPVLVLPVYAGRIISDREVDPLE